MDTLIVTLIAWIAAHSSLANAQPPHILFVSKQEMNSVYLDAANERNFFQVEAYYQPTKGTIYLPKGWRADSLRDRSVLVHELVHHLQAANHVKVSCMGALERQAYGLQFKWLSENGVRDPYGFTGLDVLTVVFAGTCPE
jgi:Domain of unknown function (DUF6647)